MFLAILAAAHLASFLFLDTHIPGVVWAGAFVAQGLHSAAGRLAEETLLKRAIQRQAMRNVVRG